MKFKFYCGGDCCRYFGDALSGGDRGDVDSDGIVMVQMVVMVVRMVMVVMAALDSNYVGCN